MQTHAECTGDREGFLTLYRSNIIHKGSHVIRREHSHCIKIKLQSTPEGSLEVCSLQPEEQQSKNSLWIDTWHRLEVRGLENNCSFLQLEGYEDGKC